MSVHSGRDHGQQSNRKLLFIAGRGFDPRTTSDLNSTATLARRCDLDLLALEFDEGESHPPQVLVDAAAKNSRPKPAKSYIVNGTINSKPIRFRSDDGRRIAARSAANVISRAEEIAGYTDVVVDVSAMPRGVYFPLISRLIFFYDEP